MEMSIEAISRHLTGKEVVIIKHMNYSGEYAKVIECKETHVNVEMRNGKLKLSLAYDQIEHDRKMTEYQKKDFQDWCDRKIREWKKVEGTDKEIRNPLDAICMKARIELNSWKFQEAMNLIAEINSKCDRLNPIRQYIDVFNAAMEG